MIDSENKAAYALQASQVREPIFVKLFGITSKMGYPLIINPLKETNVYVKDLCLKDDTINTFADLKSQTTPFFTCVRYKLHPAEEATINVYDVLSYVNQGYADMPIFFWLYYRDEKIQTFNGVEYHVPKMNRVFVTTSKNILYLDEKDRAIHFFIKEE